MAKAAPAKMSGAGGMNIQLEDEVKRNTNILAVHVPPEMRVKVRTGIDYVDDLAGAGFGFNAGTGVLISGASGCGKTTMSLQIADALTAAGYLVLYNTNEEGAQQVKMTVERLKLKHGFIIGRDRLMPKALEHMKYLMGLPSNKGKKPVFIGDSIQALDDGFYPNGGTNGNTPVRVAEQLLGWVKATYGVGILIGQVTKDGTFAGKNVIKHALDVHIHAYIDKKKKSETYGERIIECDKNRYGPSDREWVIGMSAAGVHSKYCLTDGVPDPEDGE